MSRKPTPETWTPEDYHKYPSYRRRRRAGIYPETLDFKQQHFQILARRYISSGQKIYISFVINHTYIFWPEDIYLLDRRYMLRCCEVRTWNWTKSNHPILVSSDFVVFFVFRGPKYDDIRPNDTKKNKKTKNNQKTTKNQCSKTMCIYGPDKELF